MGVLDRLERKKQKAETSSGVADRMYESMMAEIRTKATSDARLAVRSELDASKAETAAAQAETIRAEAERDAARALCTAAENIAEEHKTKVAQLTKALKLERRSLAQKDETISNQLQIAKSEVTDERLKVKTLELEVSNLKGKLSIKPQAKKITPMTIPDFKIGNIIRGSNDKIIDATISPVRIQ